MQDIFFDRIEMKNVRCHEEMAMDFPIGKFNAVTGKNGRGKSTILKALSLALYGDDGDGNKVAEMVNKKVGKDLSVIFNFRVVENENENRYRIELYYKCKGQSNNLYLFKNDVDISGKTKTDTYKMIENIYIPQTVHHNSVYFAQQVKDFFTALTNSAQKDIFNSILMLDEWDEKYDICDKKIKVIESSLIESKNRLIQINSVLPEKESSLKISLKNKQDKIDEVNNEKIRLEKQISSYKSDIFVLENSKELILSKIDLLKDVRNDLNKILVNKNILTSELNKLSESETNEKNVLNSTINSELSNKVNAGKILISEKYSAIKDTENKNLNVIQNDISKLSLKYSYDDLIKDGRDFESAKRSEQKFIDGEIYKLDNEFSIGAIQKEKDQRIKNLREKKDEISSNANSIKNAADILKTDINKLQSIIDKDQLELNKEDAFCDKCGQILGKDQREKIQKELNLNTEELDNKKKVLEDKKNEFLIIKSDYDEITRLILSTENDYNDQITEVKSKYDSKKSEYTRKKSLIDLEISDYVQIITEKINERKSNYNSELSELNQKKKLIEDKINEISRSADNDLKVLIDTTTKESLIRKGEQINDIVQRYNLRRNEISESIHKINNEISEKNILIETLTLLEKEKNDVSVQINSTKSSLNVISDMLTKLNCWVFDDKYINDIELSIKILNDEKTNISTLIEDKDRQLNILGFWKEAFSDRGIKSMLIDSAIPLMNRVCRDELEKICGGKFIVSFDTLSENKSGDVKDKFCVRVMNCETGADDHKLLSGGEKRLVDLCCMKAIRALQENQYQKRIHATFFDEALDALDDDNSEIFCRLMKQMSANQNVTIITHKALQSMEADQVYKL